jgi:cell division protein FtsW
MMMKDQIKSIALQPYLIIVFSLVGLGVVMVASSSMAIAHAHYDAPLYYLMRQALFLAFGALGALVLARIPLKVWFSFSRPLLILGLISLILLFIPGVGREINGSLRWIRLGPIGIQVSEFAKLCLFIYLAAYCAEHQATLRDRTWSFLKPLAPVLLICGLILLQPDFGSVVVILACCFGMLFLVGVPLLPFFLILGIGIAGMAGLAISAPYRFQRLTAFLNPWEDQFDTGYQLTQALIAFGRGDWFGMGLGSGVQKLLYLPEAHTDFIYAVIAEELGLIGALIVLLLYALLAFLGFRVGQQASQQGKSFHAYLAYGLSLWLGMQAFIAMGVNMGLLPTKGLTLPLISSGGSSLMISLAAIGLLVRVHLELKS